MFTDVVILAGGFGERLWPASSSDFPKQFMSLEGGVSFFQSSILRAISLNITGHILIVTRKEIDIAKVMNKTVKQIDNYCYRGKIALKLKLEEWGFLYEE